MQKFLKQYPDNNHKQEASELINSIVDKAWNQVDKTDKESLQNFIKQNPNSSHKEEAQQLINSILIEEVNPQQKEEV